MAHFHFSPPVSPALALGLLFLGLSNEAGLYSSFFAGLLLGVSLCALAKAVGRTGFQSLSRAA